MYCDIVHVRMRHALVIARYHHIYISEALCCEWRSPDDIGSTAR